MAAIKLAVALTALALLPISHACLREREFHNHGLKKRSVTPRAELSADEQFIVDSFDSNSISDWSYYYTHGNHIGGKNESQAQWTADRWAEAGLTTRLDNYHVYLNYPVSRSLILTWPNGTTFTPSLEEAVLQEDSTSSYPDRIPTFHGFSANGDVTAEYVYVGRGQQVDFERLVELGVPLEGKIALARYGGPLRGLKVKNSQEYGMIGTVIFTDPGDDGNITIANGYAAYPDGPARNPTAVQRGSVQFFSTYVGDPTTPGYPSKKDSPRADTDIVLPKIPSLPISYEDAQPILAALDGSGTPGSEVNRTKWVGALNATYATGPAPGVKLNLRNEMEDYYTDIWNAIGIINGTSSDEAIVIGNHRDAWIIGGAADPNSGTAVIVELGRVFGKLLKQGWKPKRTIVLASWDAEEYGLIGSTEWVEEYIPWIKNSVIANLNIDVAVSGSHPDISATPELHRIAQDIMKKVLWPAIEGNSTMYEIWEYDTNGAIGVLGSGSDYTSFVHRGVAAIDMGSGGGPNDPVWHYHSNFDSYDWMTKFGDPGFLAHKSMGQYLALLAYHLASDDLLPLEPLNYADEMNKYYQSLLYTIGNSSRTDFDVSILESAVSTFRTQAQEAADLAQTALATNDSELLAVVNAKYRDFQRGFTSQGGLPDREFYQHLIFAPGLDTGYAPVTFPGITEAVDAEDWAVAEEYLEKTRMAIEVAGNTLAT
ncbi:Putative PA domain, transferrin receptor-like, dimerization domain, peptidase M28 [Septoria linicola]|uniref:PA domain, transferrin receptor-like, dimerization domain, peptidase M28 n=1 Tax=Septoria linicola TaxID=215465 RepID=A0A9Q9AUI8_9PEZI|nr:putative PA domain, transferrin receptor-like, dimerization domain, peptidase M28 [Septoria linicola]USW53453.1 Putative PA domain, transferrin receptor-like, dimerization domain, peptidase M28 [Septoria linicola]